MSAAARFPTAIHQPRQKYSAKRAEVDGIVFASKMEAAYYLHLKTLEAVGDVRSIALQPRFELQPMFKKHGKTFRSITYVADFGVVMASGERRVIDVKGFKTPVFSLKQKLYSRLYDEPLILVTKTRQGWREWA